MRTPAVLLLALLLVACAALPGLPARTPAPRLITRQQAIDIAVKSASLSRPEVSAALEPLTNIKAEQMLLWQAMYRMTGSANIPNGYLPGAPVWYVTMDGLWQDEMPAPGITPVPGYYRHAMEIIDALTGMEIEGGMRP